MYRTNRGRTEKIIAALSLLVVVSMILGTLLTALPERKTQVQPTPTAKRAAATSTPALATPTPTASPVLQPTPLPKPTS